MAEIAAQPLAAAARALMLAGRWDQANALLSAAAGDAAERAALAVAEAEVAVDHDFWCRTDRGSSVLPRASAALASAPEDPVLAYDLEFLRLRHDYAAELFGPGGVPRFGPDGREAAVIDALAARAEGLRATAPDRARGAAATFYAGLIADNLRGDGAAARTAFAAALSSAQEAGDDLTVSEALRHLGYHHGEAGDTEQARQMWERSAELRAAGGRGAVCRCPSSCCWPGWPGTAGTRTGARVAVQVRRWAHALGVGLLESQAALLAEGAR